MTIKLLKILIFIQIICFFSCNISANVFNDNIPFYVYSNGVVLTSQNICTPSTPDEKFAIIVHGWTESCQTEWVLELISKLTQFRGGCIICMDYSAYSKGDYFILVSKFNNISLVLTEKLFALEAQGYNPSNGYIFGFSYGAQLAFESGRKFGFRKLGEIDACEPAGPGFDIQPVKDPLSAAKNVQCIHTSIDFGTLRRNCNQDWMMGVCGIVQYAAGPFPKGNHGLCPYFYNSAFTNNFLAAKPNGCVSCRQVLTWPSNYKMGYTETRKSEVHGDLFAETSNAYPYINNKLANVV